MIKSIALEILRENNASKSSSPNESSIKEDLHTIATDQALIFAGVASSRKRSLLKHFLDLLIEPSHALPHIKTRLVFLADATLRGIRVIIHTHH